MPTKKKPAKVETKAGQAKPKKATTTKKGKVATPVETPEVATLPAVSPTIAPVAEQPETTPECPTVEEAPTTPAEVATESPTVDELATPTEVQAAEIATPEQPATPATTPTSPAKMSALDAAAKLLRETGRTMSTPEMIATMAKLGYWTSPGGKTPHATLYSAILREITTKGTTSRFIKIDRGQFAHR